MTKRIEFIKIFLVGIVLTVAFQSTSEAEEWSLTPSIKAGENYDDNILLTTQAHSSVSSTTISPRLDFGVSSDIWEVDGGIELARSRFPDHNELNYDAQYYNLGSTYKTERSTWQLQTSSSQTSYLADQTISPNVGLFGINTSSDQKSFSPSWNWSMTERTQVQLAYTQSDISYVNGQSFGLFDYRSSVISAKISNQLDIRTQIFFSPSYSLFRVPSTTYESKSASYEVGLTRAFSDTLNGTLAVGTRKASTQQVSNACVSGAYVVLTTGQLSFICFQSQDIPVYQDLSSSIFNFSLDKQFQTVHLSATLSRAFEPTAVGQQAQTDSASLSLSMFLTEKLTGNFSVNGYRLSSEVNEAANNDRRVYVVEPGLRWFPSEGWYVDLSYRYLHLKRDYESTAAISNAVYLTTQYQWSKISFSR